MALGKLPGRPTPICVECMDGPTAYTKGGFLLHVSCIPGLRDPRDIISLYTRARVGPGAVRRCSVHPEISGYGMIRKGGVSGLMYTNDLRIVAYGAVSCGLSGMMQEVSAGAKLDHITFCVAVKGR